MTASTASQQPKPKSKAEGTGEARSKGIRQRAMNSEAREQDKTAAVQRALATDITAARSSVKAREKVAADGMILTPLSVAEAHAITKEQELREINAAEMKRRAEDYKTAQSERVERLKELTDFDPDDEEKVVVNNPTDRILEFSVSAELFFLEPGDNTVLPVKQGMTAQRVGEAALEQLGGLGLTLTIEKPKSAKATTTDEDEDEVLRREKEALVGGRGGALLGYPSELAEGLIGVENPSAGERMQPIRPPNDDQRWTEEQLENAHLSMFPDKAQPGTTRARKEGSKGTAGAAPTEHKKPGPKPREKGTSRNGASRRVKESD